MLSIFRKIAFLEGVSFLLIGITMYMKYEMAMPKPNYIVGLAHGVLFITSQFLHAGVRELSLCNLINCERINYILLTAIRKH